MRRLTHPRSKLSAIVCATIFAAAVSASAKDGDARTCETKFGGQVVCGDLVVGITLEQYEAGLNKRAEEIRAQEAEKRVQLQKLMELTERATEAEKGSLRSQVAAVEAEKRALEAESKGVADRLTNLQASYDGLVQKLTEANAALEAFAPLISKDAFEQAQAMLSRGDVLGAERKFVEIADTIRKIRDQANVVEARAIFQAGELAEQRIDWRAAYAHYARAARLQPSDWQYVQHAGNLARKMGDYATATSFNEAALKIVTSVFGPDALETATALDNLALTYQSLARYAEAEPLFRRAILDRRNGSRQRSSQRCDPLQQSRQFASCSGQICRGRSVVSAGNRDRRNVSPKR
jgi:tetratricopeptide (TPR) repeat protein